MEDWYRFHNRFQTVTYKQNVTATSYSNVGVEAQPILEQVKNTFNLNICCDELGIASLSRDLVCLFSHAIGLPTGPRTSNNDGGSQHRFLLWTLHGQNDTKFRFSAHHAGVAFGGFHEWVLFNHWAYAGHLREAERVFGVGRDSS